MWGRGFCCLWKRNECNCYFHPSILDPLNKQRAALLPLPPQYPLISSFQGKSLLKARSEAFCSLAQLVWTIQADAERPQFPQSMSSEAPAAGCVQNKGQAICTSVFDTAHTCPIQLALRAGPSMLCCSGIARKCRGCPHRWTIALLPKRTWGFSHCQAKPKQPALVLFHTQTWDSAP